MGKGFKAGNTCGVYLWGFGRNATCDASVRVRLGYRPLPGLKARPCLAAETNLRRGGQVECRSAAAEDLVL